MNHNDFVPANGSSVGSSAVPNQGKSTGANTDSNRRHKSAGKVIDPKVKEAVRPHVKVSLEDINWVRAQQPCVQQLWLDCMAVEQFGNQQRELKTSLSSKSFRRARIALQKQKLFDFEPITKLSQSGHTNISGWKVQNLHGYYIKKYWELEVVGGENLPRTRENLPRTRENLPRTRENLPRLRENLPEEKLETLAIHGVDFFQPSNNQGSTTHQPPTKVVGGVVSNLKQEESPQGATDCPTLSGGIGSGNESESQLGAEPPDPQTQSLEGRLPGGEMLSPPKGDPPLEASQGEEVGIQFLKGVEESPKSSNSLAALEDQEAANQESKNLGEDNFSATPVECEKSEIEEAAKVEVTDIMSPSFPQQGDKAVLDWPESLYHQKVGTIKTVQTESGEAEIRFEGINFDLTFPTNRLLPAAVLSVEQVATPGLTAGFKIGDRVWWDKVPRHADFKKPFEIARFIGNTAWLKGYSRRAVPLSDLRLADASNLET